MKKRFPCGVGLLIVEIFGIACSSRPSDRIILKDVPEARETAQPVKSAVQSPSCPPAGIAPLQPLQPHTGHHKVTLSWKASASSSGPANDAVGYCLYRSTTQNAASRNPTCALCEQINVVPVAGVSCVDDLVEDSTTYYYVVTAINAAGKISPASNQFTVVIAPGSKIKAAPPGSPPPSCRAAAQPPVK